MTVYCASHLPSAYKEWPRSHPLALYDLNVDQQNPLTKTLPLYHKVYVWVSLCVYIYVAVPACSLLSVCLFTFILSLFSSYFLYFTSSLTSINSKAISESLLLLACLHCCQYWCYCFDSSFIRGICYSNPDWTCCSAVPTTALSCQLSYLSMLASLIRIIVRFK